MQVNISDEQLTMVIDVVDARVREIHPEIRRSHLYDVRDELNRDLESLQQLLEHLQETQRDAQSKEEWAGYVQTRQAPSNPSPG